ncbi:VOC family protein [Rhodobacter sp. Har01]|uniref:VOC family protein n=1 Tax=Rhodobacter sp. Har01 TaxID=2883999 RepID=UPI001D06D348|nr:VOC family protein [Rhodobacter sp. Har01]MCB6177358.1 VOC family protein [Rhodobacter sp. Har01]
MPALTVQTCLWVDTRAEKAARPCSALIPGAQILQILPDRADPARAFLVHLSSAGQRTSFLDGGPHDSLAPAASIKVEARRVTTAMMQMVKLDGSTLETAASGGQPPGALGLSAGFEDEAAVAADHQPERRASLGKKDARHAGGQL